MGVPQHRWLHFIVDGLNRCKWVDHSDPANPIVKTSSPPVPLPQRAKGWKDISIDFGTNFKYWSLLRSFSVPIQFVGDGAIIVRDTCYNGKGYEDELYFIILKLNDDTGIYDLEYKGRIDLKKHLDEPRKGITCNTIESGVQTYITANEGVPYEIACNETNPAAKQGLLDGTNLYDKYRYTMIEFDSTGQGTSAVAFQFISNEGDSVGVIKGSQSYDPVPFDTSFENSIDVYCASSANYFYASINQIEINIKGTLRISSVPDSGDLLYRFRFHTSLGNVYEFYNDTVVGNQTFEIPIDLTITLKPNEKIFFINHFVGFGHFYFHSSDVFVSFVSKNDATSFYFLEPLDMLKGVVNKMTEGKYTIESNFFNTVKTPVFTSTNAIRNFDAAVIQMSFQDCFNDLDCQYDLGIKIINDTIWIEPKKDLYKPDQEIFDVGEIAGLKLRYADDLLCNSASIGYKSQDYRQSNGKYEFNTTTHFKFPVNTLQKDFARISKSRADCFGIEFERAKIFDKQTTDSTGDNQTFLIDINDEPGITYLWYQGSFQTQINAGNYYILIPKVIDSLPVGSQITISDADENNGTYTVENFSYVITGCTLIKITEAVTDNVNLSGLMYTVSDEYYGVYRDTYDSIDGVLDGSIYNYRLSPHHMLLRQGNTLASLMPQLKTGKITFNTCDKNGDISTVINGVSFSEKQDETISKIGIAIYLPWYAEFTTRVPMTFSKIMSNVGTGYIKGTFLGQPLYFLPIGKMSANPGTNASQSWTLLLAPTNNISSLNQLSAEGLFTMDDMGNTIFTSDLNPCHFIKYNYSKPPQYKHLDKYDAQFQDRKDQFISDSYYLQKWEKTDPIVIQQITRGLAELHVDLCNEQGEVIDTFPMDITVNSAVRTPYVLWNVTLDLSSDTYPEGIYCAVIRSGTDTYVRKSEWWDVRDEHPGTVLVEFSHTTNKYKFYFGNVTPCIRVEARLLPWYPDATFETYTDEIADNEMLDGIPWEKRKLRILAVPDWMATKLNMITLLNKWKVEGIYYSRTESSKMEKKEYAGFDMYSYIVEISRSNNSYGLSTDETNTEDSTAIAYTLDGQAFGLSEPGKTIDIETT